MPDYHTVLLPGYLENAEQLHGGISQAEISFFDTLSKIPGMPEIQRNVRLPGSRYNIDGVADNVAIEFFGTLWHADPNRYADEHQFQFLGGVTAAEIREKDQRKIAWLEQQGYHAVVVWESEWRIKSNRQACIDRVLAAFNQN